MEQRGVNDSDYLKPSHDEATAVGKSIEILRDMEVRSVRAAAMGYTTSHDNEKKHFRTQCLAGAATAVVTPFSTLTMKEVINHAFVLFPRLKPKNSVYSPYFIAGGLATMLAVCVFKGTMEVVFPMYKERAKVYNKAAAEWQTLELNIRSFLAAAVKDNISSAECREFIDECAEKRKEICLIARPGQDMYKKYQDNPDIITRMQSLKKIHEERIKDKLY